MEDEKRLIDANELLKDAEDYSPISCGLADMYDVKWLVDAQPTVDAVEVVHAEWTLGIDELDCEFIECPLCGEQFYDGDNDTFDKPYNYCPNCGAKMDLED